MRKVIYILVFFTLYACNDKEKRDFEKGVSINHIPDSIDYFSYVRNLKSEITNRGNIDSYKNLRNIYMDDCQELDMLPYSLIMANKFNHSFAYFDVFVCLVQTHYYQNIDDIYNLEILDYKTRDLALKYLMQSYVRGDKRANDLILKYKREAKYFLADTIIYRKELTNIP